VRYGRVESAKQDAEYEEGVGHGAGRYGGFRSGSGGEDDVSDICIVSTRECMRMECYEDILYTIADDVRVTLGARNTMIMMYFPFIVEKAECFPF
jgi:hypothetical protein